MRGGWGRGGKRLRGRGKRWDGVVVDVACGAHHAGRNPASRMSAVCPMIDICVLGTCQVALMTTLLIVIPAVLLVLIVGNAADAEVDGIGPVLHRGI